MDYTCWYIYIDLFEQRHYYAAWDLFKETSDYFEQVLSLASRYGLTDQKAELTRLTRACQQNVEEARGALYKIDTPPDLTTIEDVNAMAPEFDSIELGEQGIPFGRQIVEDRVQDELPEHEVLE